MFGTSKEVKKISADTKGKVDAMWKKWNQDVACIENSDFVSKILEFNERNHPKTLLGKKKKLDDYFHIGSDIIENFDFNIFAKQMDKPNSNNLGDCFNSIDFENELIISIFYSQLTGFILTDKHIYLLLKGGKLLDVSTNYYGKKLSEIKELSLGKGFSQIPIVVNGDEIGNIYKEDSHKYTRILLNEVARNSSDLIEDPVVEQKIVTEETGLDKLKKLKELLDLGVLSQEEFDAKKDEIMKTL